jgi:hypothetical protein
MRVRLDDPELVASLLAFLRGHHCIVEQIAADTLAVWCPPAHENGSGPPRGELTCRNCGTPVADALGRLGSLRCHDCRDEALETLLPGVYGLANGNGDGHRARGDLASYVAEWEAAHAGARAVIG